MFLFSLQQIIAKSHNGKIGLNSGLGLCDHENKLNKRFLAEIWYSSIINLLLLFFFFGVVVVVLLKTEA